MRFASMARLAPFSRRGFTRTVLGLLAVGIAISYAGAIGAGFYFDDIYGIHDNPALRSLANIPQFFSDPFTLTTVRENVDVRPVLVTSYAINYAISGVRPWSYHVFNLIVHFAASVLVFLLVRDHVWWPEAQRGPEGAARWPAAAAALFFALAPINNQAVNYMWARSALLCTALYLAAFHALLSRRLVASVALHVLALLTKAIAVTLPAVFIAYDFLYRDRRRHPGLREWLADWRELVVPVGPLLVADAAYLLYRWMLLPDWAYDALHEVWVTPWIWLISQWSALLHYVRIFLWPAGLSVDHDLPFTLSLAETRAWASLLVLTAWIAAALRWSRRLPHVAFATLWFFVTLAPESTIVPLAEVVNDHRPYIASSLGLAVLLAWLVERGALLAGRFRRTVFMAAVSLLCLGAVVVGARRSYEWADEQRLWESTVKASPNNGRAWMNAGRLHLRKGNTREARRYFERSRQLLPAYPYLYMNLSALELAEGRPKEAVAWAQEAVRFGSGLSRSYSSLGRAYEQQGRFADAVAAWRHASELDPNDAAAREAHERAAASQASQESQQSEGAIMTEGLRLLDVERDAGAAAVKFRQVLERNPAHYGATWQLARALDAAGRPEEARPVWEKMLEMARNAKDAASEARVRERLRR